MKEITTLLCVLAMLGHYLALGTPATFKIHSSKVICSDDNFIKDIDMNVLTDGPTPTLNCKYEIIKEFPKDLMCGIEFFQKEGDEYKKMPVAFPPDNCCKVFNNDMLKKAMEKQNVPKGCPIKEGKYELSKYTVPDDMLSDDADRGEYRSVFKMTLPSGSCLYGQESDWQIADKE